MVYAEFYHGFEVINPEGGALSNNIVDISKYSKYEGFNLLKEYRSKTAPLSLIYFQCKTMYCTRIILGESWSNELSGRICWLYSVSY